MKSLCIGDTLQIHSYKHNGKIHRSWSEAVVLDITKDYIVFANNKTLVIKAEGVSWRTKEPAVIYFFRNEWFNVITQIKKDGVYYYCNIASPYIIEENTVKYIDYDLDLRIFPNRHFKILDRLEYQYHKKIMNYSKDLETAINGSLDKLIKLYTNGSNIFNDEINLKYAEQFKKLKEDEEKSNF